MKWYWILLIVIGAIILGMVVASAVKPKAKTTSSLKGEVISSSVTDNKPVMAVVKSNSTSDVVTSDNGDGSKTTTIMTK